MTPEDVDARLGKSLSAEATDAVQRAMQRTEPCVSGPKEVFRTQARWSVSRDFDGKHIFGPRHQTLRRRGVAPRYPHPSALHSAIEGDFVIVDGGIVLEPERATHPCTHICAASIARTLFYADALAVFFDDHQRAVIAVNDVERIDLLFQSRF